MKKTFLVLSFVLVFFSCERITTEERKLLLEDDIAVVNGFNGYFSDLNFDISSFANKTSQNIVDFINETNITLDSIKGLTKDVAYKDISTYSMGYECGGTAGFIPHSILNYNLNGKNYSINISEDKEMKFDSIIRINKEFYLLLGGHKAYSNAHSEIAYIIKISDKQIDIDYPAFVNRPYLNFINGVYEYDSANAVLKFQGEEHQKIHEIFNHKDKYRKFAEDTISSRKLYEMIKGLRYFETKSFILKFNGNNFERIDDEDDFG